jgi:hypothetical protein
MCRALCDCVAQRGLLALEFSSAVEVEHAIVQVYALASEDVAALKLSGRALLFGSVGHRGDQQNGAQDQARADRAACSVVVLLGFMIAPVAAKEVHLKIAAERRRRSLRIGESRAKGSQNESSYLRQHLQASRRPDHLKVFANEDAAKKWFSETRSGGGGARI